MTLARMAGAIRMTDQPKIGIVYRDRVPQLLVDNLPEGILWKVECFQESAVIGGPIIPSRDYLVVFYSIKNQPPEIQRHLSNMFPGAEIVGYRNSDDSPDENLSKNEDGLLVVQLPMQFQLARYLMESFATARAYQRELMRAERRAEGIQDFFDAFVHTVESSSDITDRKLGMSLLINKILAHVPAEECILYLFGEASATLQRVYSTGNIKDIDLFEQHANSSIIEKVMSGGAPYLNNNYSFELRVPFSKDSVYIRSILCYPLVRRGERIGAIELINKNNGVFTKEDQALIEMMLNPLAIAIRTVDMFEDAERLTITDDLTKLFNYRYLMKYLEADVKRCLRYKKKVSLLFIDVDGFKRINDTFGHLVGSQALAEMGQVFKRIVRETDVVGRYGGDEFVIVLPETPLNGAMVIAERIRKKVEECEFVAQNLSIRLTVSLGVANCPKHTLTAEGLIKKADAAMYRAKELSKNSIKVAV
jgi:diguanylate cyclase (GGDEF)-like protein